MIAKPWYREPWPWILMSGPAIVVVAGIATAALAVTSFDGLVADDYYKQGLAINRVLERETHARELGLAATLQFSEDRRRVRLIMAGVPAERLTLKLLHPTIPAEDQVIDLAPAAPGIYGGVLHAPRMPVLQVQLQDARGTWRLDGEWHTAAAASRLEPR